MRKRKKYKISSRDIKTKKDKLPSSRYARTRLPGKW